MADHFTWLLPEGIEAPGPGRSSQREKLRRTLLNLYKSWGYLQVSPPLIEHAEYFRSAEDFTSNQRLFFLTDPMTGRQLALRADATSQIARLRASVIADRPNPVRLCYCLPTLHRHPESLGVPRFFYQVGLELFGGDELDADSEVLELMCRSMQYAEVGELIFSLGHTGFFTALMEEAGIVADERSGLQTLLQSRAIPELRAAAERLRLSAKHTELLCALASAHGHIDDLAEALKPFAAIANSAEAAEQLRALAASAARFPGKPRLQFDLAEAHGQLYHRGLVFACFTPQHGTAVARGGRYLAQDGSLAVGFSSNLWLLASLGDADVTEPHRRILAPARAVGEEPDALLQQAIEQLRRAGECVVQALVDQDIAAADCTHQLEFDGEQWKLVPLN